MRHERRVIFALCFLAALRVFVFSAAFPFFNNVDEQAHVDLVFKHSHGYLPRGLDNFSAESAYYLTLYATPEYFLKPQRCAGSYPPPAWTSVHCYFAIVVNWPAFASQYNFFRMWQ